MLFLQFKVGNDRYVLEVKNIIEIVPFVHLKLIPKAPPYLAGLLNYRGTTIPVIDISYLMNNMACELKLSSRIALIKYTVDDGKSICLGLLSEHMTETVRFNENDFSDSP